MTVYKVPVVRSDGNCYGYKFVTNLNRGYRPDIEKAIAFFIVNNRKPSDYELTYVEPLEIIHGTQSHIDAYFEQR